MVYFLFDRFDEAWSALGNLWPRMEHIKWEIEKKKGTAKDDQNAKKLSQNDPKILINWNRE